MFLQKQNKELVLVKRFLAGDRNAQETLFKLLDKLLEKGLQALESKGSFFHDRENVKQSIAVDLLIKDDSAVLRNFKGQSKLTTYLWSAIRFKLIDKLRAEMAAMERQNPIPENLATDFDEQPGELHELIGTFIAQTDEMDAAILHMRWQEDLSYDSICQRAAQNGWEVTQSYIGNLLFRKRNELAEYLKKHGYEIDKLMTGKKHTSHNRKTHVG